MEKVKALRTKLRWLDISIYGPTYMFYDNKSVVKSKSKAERTLSKKCQLIYWNFVRENISAGWMRVFNDPGGITRRVYLLNNCLYKGSRTS